jgi:hypothetical protein
MRSAAEIPSLLERIYKENLELSLINVYKGFPISYPAQIIAIDRKSIQVQSNPFQIVCIHQDKETYMRSPIFPHTVHAHIMKIDIPQSQAVLSQFEYVAGSIGERKQVRVEPATSLEGVIKPEEKHISFTGEIADISLDGIAILLSPGLQAPKILREGTRVILHLQLPVEIKPPPAVKTEIIPQPQIRTERFSGIKRPATEADIIEEKFPDLTPIYGQSTTTGIVQKEFVVEGIVRNVVADRHLRKHRIGIKLLNNGPQRSAISQFILQRQAQLLQEIRQLYQVLAQTYTAFKKRESSR